MYNVHSLREKMSFLEMALIERIEQGICFVLLKSVKMFSIFPRLHSLKLLFIDSQQIQSDLIKIMSKFHDAKRQRVRGRGSHEEKDKYNFKGICSI